MVAPYKYNRLDPATDAIRLLTLMRGEPSQPIECEIFETYLHQIEVVPYEALSYVWGTRTSADCILLSGCQFNVTENLREALVHLRRPDKDRVLWVDAICIDQAHDAERGHQVRQMRLIYQNAQRVVIWLGASNSDIDCLFDWMVALDQQVLLIARPHTLSTWENQWSWLVWNLRGKPPPERIKVALGEMLRREWFSRMWVLQEAALAKSAMVTCGWNGVNSRAFVVMPWLLSVDCGEGVQARLDILPGLLRTYSWWAGSSNKDLLTLLQKFGRSKASDPRDIIYALLGLSQDAHSSGILQPNYQISVQETIQHSVAYFMLQTHDLSEQTSIRSLPEWNIEEFLDSLHDLPINVFQWATGHAQDTLLYDLIVAQRRKHDAVRLRSYMSCSGIHGPPITIAMKKSNLALFELVLQVPGADIKSEDSDGETPLSLAVKQGNIALGNLILDCSQFHIGKGDPDNNTALVFAAKQGRSALRELLTRYPHLNLFARDRWGDTLLLTAVKEGDLAVVQEMSDFLSIEDDTAVRNANGDTALNIAARKGDERIVALLVQKCSDPPLRGRNGLTAFEEALVRGHSGVVMTLLDHYRGGAYDVARADQFDHRDIITAPPESDGSFGFQTLLGSAAWSGDTARVSSLLDNGVDIDSRDRDDRAATPLWYAARCGRLGTVKLLVKRGADMELVAKHAPTRTTPLWAAAAKGHTPVVMYLLGAGARVQDVGDVASTHALKKSPGIATVLWAATFAGKTEVVKALAEQGVNLEVFGPWFSEEGPPWAQAFGPRFADRKPWAKPVWAAVCLGYMDMVDVFIEHGAHIETIGRYDVRLPFWVAARKKLPEAVAHRMGLSKTGQIRLR